MTKNTRRFVLAFGLTLGVVLLIVAAAGLYRWGYNGAIAEKGTYDAGFAAAMAERGTYQEGYDAAIAEKGTYDDGYTAGFAKGKTEGYEEGYAAGHEDGSSEGYDAGYDSGTSDAAQSAAEAEKNTRVWVSKRLGSRYHSSPDCPLVIKPKEMTRQEAEDEGYTGLERNVAGTAAGSAYSVKHLALAALAVVGSTFAGIAAGFAALRLIGEALFSKKLLLVGGEGEFLSAIFADDRFVLEHVVPL